MSEFRVIDLTRDFAVVYKPYGYLSEDDAQRDNVPAAIRAHLADLGERREGVYCVHRLDCTTAGLMVYALNQKTAAELSSQVALGKFHKTYVAYTSHSAGLESCGEMRDMLFFDRRAQKSFVVGDGKKSAKEARLSYEIEAEFDFEGERVARVRVNLHTGRTHQIRVQFGSRGAALIGDGKYGSRVKWRGCALYSAEIGFCHGGGEKSYRLSDAEYELK